MTSYAPRPVDLDLLADYVDGLLDDDARAEVSALINADERWSAMHTALISALASVDSDLHTYAGEQLTMPTDVAARITAALRAETPAEPAAGERAEVISLDRARERRTRSPMRRRLAAAAVIALVAAGGVAIGLHVSSSGTDSSGGSVTASAPKAAAGPEKTVQSLPSVPGLAVSASGQDYTARILRGTALPRPDVTAPRTPSGGVATQDGPFGQAGATVPAGLSRLLSASALEQCMTAIQTADGGTPIDVDFASYNGSAALVVGLAGGGFFVAGPDCGLEGRGADEIARG